VNWQPPSGSGVPIGIRYSGNDNVGINVLLIIFSHGVKIYYS